LQTPADSINARVQGPSSRRKHARRIVRGEFRTIQTVSDIFQDFS